MPIPPRPIPVHPRTKSTSTPTRTGHPASASAAAATATAKPGSSVPRKSIMTLGSSLDWRAEIALLGDRSRSVPVNELSGVRLVSHKVDIGTAHVGKGREEVGLMDLIEDGKGKREKRATTATTLGFDFIPNHAVLDLPRPTSAMQAAATSSAPQTRSSLLSRSPFSLFYSSKSAINPSLAGAEGLAKTPSTPGLIPVSDVGDDAEIKADEEDDDDDDDEEWERVSQADEGEMIMLGELELEGDLEVEASAFDIVVDARDSTHDGAKLCGKGARISYAAALGGVVVA